jgi:riboflavin kinase/FMN adenylyltransferase
LGRPYTLSGLVVPGDGRGRTIGIPTANLNVWPEQALPKAGVYVCQVSPLDRPNESRPAVTNVGLRPTFENQPVLPRVEAHLLDFNQDLYGRRLRLSFLQRLRDEQKFSGVPALLEQIHKDVEDARTYLAGEAANPWGA